MHPSEPVAMSDDFHSRFRQPQPTRYDANITKSLDGLSPRTTASPSVSRRPQFDRLPTQDHPLSGISPIHMQLLQRPFDMRARRANVNRRPINAAPALSRQESELKVTAIKEPIERQAQADYISDAFNHEPLREGQDSRFSKFRLTMQKIGYSLALIILIVGCYVTFDSARSNRMVVAQARQLEKANSEVAPEDSTPTAPGDNSDTKDESPVSAGALASYSVPANMPKYLIVDDLGIKARVRQQGRDKTGAVGVPNNVFDVGWFTESAKPGTAGAAFFDGHVAGYTSHGSLYDLKNAEAGTEIRVIMGDDTEIKYRIVSKDFFPEGDVDMVKALSPIQQDKFGLNIMTCAGNFDARSDSYAERLVVYAAAE